MKISTRQEKDYLAMLYFGREGESLTKCINRTYRDFCRTLRGLGKLPEKEELFQETRSLISNQLHQVASNRNITQEEFDSWHKGVCESLNQLFARFGFSHFTIGQAQKWINMTIKYSYLFQDLKDKFKSLYPVAHFPIDNIILQKLTYIKLGSPWSKLDNYQEYLKVQQMIREQSTEKCSLEYEFITFMTP